MDSYQSTPAYRPIAPSRYCLLMASGGLNRPMAVGTSAVLIAGAMQQTLLSWFCQPAFSISRCRAWLNTVSEVGSVPSVPTMLLAC